MLRRSIKIAVSCLALLIFTLSLAISTPAYAGTITLYEGNGGQQDVVNSYNDRPDYDGQVKPNDEARSLKLSEVQPFTIITVADSPEGGSKDDITTIKVKQKTPRDLVVGTFENSFENEYVKVEHSHNNGLDGKVSHIKITGFDF
ncbi:MAG: hypothetical protein V7K90_00550 [Nostoc sp.]|uniref:hypothetical protein n=1 Tax=Nostoc sp. TaxID=1180 RepID=UPI002FFAA6EC